MLPPKERRRPSPPRFMGWNGAPQRRGIVFTDVEHQSYCRVSQAFHIRETVCFIYVELCVSHTWNCAFHLRETLCFIYVELCVSSTWDCVFHLRGTVYSTYVELYVPPTWDDVSYTWGRAFHLLEL